VGVVIADRAVDLAENLDRASLPDLPGQADRDVREFLATVEGVAGWPWVRDSIGWAA